MASIFPAQRNYRFSSGLMNLKFMQRASANQTESSGSSLLNRGGSRLKNSSALTVFEANRREMESRMHASNTVLVEEENSISRLYGLVSGRFSFRGYSFQLDPLNMASMEQAACVKKEQALMDNDEEDEMETDTSTKKTQPSSGKRKTPEGGHEYPEDSHHEPTSRLQKESQKGSTSNDTSGGQGGRYFTKYSNSSKRGKFDRAGMQHNRRHRGGQANHRNK